ncbi:MAG TPA: hypothetical protein VD794_05135, partial [Flavisolibacter sp.]|nr:hypothetical protein [Flavisolibacter sp.]
MKQLKLLTLFIGVFTTAISQSTKTLSTPEKDFETFWQTFNDHYAFFQLKGVNWDSTYARYRPRVTSKTKEKQLLSLFEQMVAPLNDGHITISKGDDVLYKVRRPSYFRQAFSGLEKPFWETVYTTLQNNEFTS